jgi:hypothetical protein
MITPELLAKLDRLREAVTPEPRFLLRYEHGGGRWIREQGDDRTLIADFYHEGDREFIVAACNLNAALVARIRELEAENAGLHRRLHPHELRAEMRDDVAKYAEARTK